MHCVVVDVVQVMYEDGKKDSCAAEVTDGFKVRWDYIRFSGL